MTQSVTRSARSATADVFNTVGTLASQVSKTIDSAGSGIDMLNSFVATAREKQVARTSVDLHHFYEELHEQAAETTATRQAELKHRLASDQQFKDLFEENYKSMNDLINKLKTEAGR